MHDYLAINRANWNSRVPEHVKGYDLERFRSDPSFLSAVVRYDLPRLGAVRGLRGVHLQCHIGTDTASLARLGAAMSGLDLSPASLAAARSLAGELGLAIEYVEGDVYRSAELLGAGAFDFVYTGVGALCWLPDIRRWAATVASLLKPGGWLLVRDGHPMLFTLDEPGPDGRLVVRYPYFESEGVLAREERTYQGDGTPLASPESVSFNHGIAQMLAAVRDAGLAVELFEEHESAPWNPLGPACEASGDAGEWRLRAELPRIPLTFTLRARKI